MAKGIRRYNWPLFDFGIARPSLYVLGAGASLPITPRQVVAVIRKIVRDNGVYEGSPQPATPFKNHLFPFDERHEVEAMLTGGISQNEFDAHTPSALLETLLSRVITVPNAGRPAQYAVFDRFPSSVLFNFNNDNLGDAVHRRHLCLRPHGVVDMRLVHSKGISTAIKYLAVPDSFVAQLDFHRPVPETTRITSRAEYGVLAQRFSSLAAVVIIGYSFGEQPTTGSIDDSESFEMLTDLLRWRSKPVLVIDPNPERICLRIESAVRKTSISALQCKWNVLAEFILTGAYERARRETHKKGLQAITSLYWHFEDALAMRDLNPK